MSERRVKPYPHAPRTREELVLTTFEYRFPFSYENITVESRF